MATSLWSGFRVGTVDGPRDDGSLHRRVCSSEKRTGPIRRSRPQFRSETVAWPEWQLPPGGTTEDYMAAREEGSRAFTLWRDQDRGEVFARVVTRSASRGQTTEYEVRDADGNPLAVVVRDPESLSRLRRARWTVRQLDQAKAGGQDVVGRKGKIAWWCVWLPLFPFQYLLMVVSFGEFSGIDPPRRTRFRSRRRVVLDYHGLYEDLEVRSDGWDPRVTTALLVLIESWDSEVIAKSGRPSFP